MSFRTSRKLIGTREAAKILGVSQCRIRQLVAEGSLWSEKVGASLVLDENETKALRKTMAALRAGGHVRGPKPGGFKPDRPGSG